MGDPVDESLPRLPSWREDTYTTRLTRLERRSRQVVAVGAGLTPSWSPWRPVTPPAASTARYQAGSGR